MLTPSRSLPRCALIKIFLPKPWRFEQRLPVNRGENISKMAALRYRYSSQCLIHLRRSIFSSAAMLAKPDKPTIIEEESVEVKTVDQTVSSLDHVIVIWGSCMSSLVSKACVVYLKNRRKDMCVYSSRPGMQCNQVPTTPINGKLSLKMKKDGKTHWWAGAQRKRNYHT